MSWKSWEFLFTHFALDTLNHFPNFGFTESAFVLSTYFCPNREKWRIVALVYQSSTNLNYYNCKSHLKVTHHFQGSRSSALNSLLIAKNDLNFSPTLGQNDAGPWIHTEQHTSVGTISKHQNSWSNVAARPWKRLKKALMSDYECLATALWDWLLCWQNKLENNSKILSWKIAMCQSCHKENY